MKQLYKEKVLQERKDIGKNEERTRDRETEMETKRDRREGGRSGKVGEQKEEESMGKEKKQSTGKRTQWKRKTVVIILYYQSNMVIITSQVNASLKPANKVEKIPCIHFQGLSPTELVAFYRRDIIYTSR